MCRSFSLEELMEATNNFDNSAFMGEGSYGKVLSKYTDFEKSLFIFCVFTFFHFYFSFIMQLFKGRLENGNQVAIRCLPLSKKFSIRNLKLRLDLLSKLQHQHLVYLLGHCLDYGGGDIYSLNKVYLVYDYVPNGSFRDHLSGNF